jgi:hypothetical protein
MRIEETTTYLEMTDRSQLVPAKTVHTSSFDHPQALRNYQSRGFRVVKTERSPKDVPDKPPGPWFGANRPRSL